jgi:hypothetical protein
MKSRLLGAVSACIFSMAFSAVTNATLVFNTSFNDPTGTFSPYYSDIQSHVFAAGAAWGSYIVGDASLEVQINFSTSIQTATGGSVTSSFVRNDGVFNVFEQGAAGEINTGVDPNNVQPDIEFTFGSDYLINELWFDPDPFSRTATIASNRTDAVSVVLHEFGHAFAFNGWRDPLDGSLPSDFQSTFDEHVFFDGDDLFFQGPRAINVFGGDVPLTTNNYDHLGNNLPRPESELILDLMNGVNFYRETRYNISALDIAILTDSGFTVVPIPAAFWLFGSGLLGMIGVARRKNVSG